MNNPYELYMSIRSPFARRVRVLLEELGLSYEIKTVDVFKPSSDYKSINPFLRVPSLKTESGEIISDSNQIMFYLEKKYSHHPVFQSPGVSQEKIRQISALSTGLMEYVVANYLETLRPGAKQDEEFFADYRNGISNVLEIFQIEILASKGAYLFGNQFGIWDIDCGVALGYCGLRMKNKGINLSKELTNYYEQLQKRKSFEVSTPPN